MGEMDPTRDFVELHLGPSRKIRHDNFVPAGIGGGGGRALYQKHDRSNYMTLLGGSGVVISRVISPLVWVISIVTLLITLRITTHEPPSNWNRQRGTPSSPAYRALTTLKPLRSIENSAYRPYKPYILNPRPTTTQDPTLTCQTLLFL